MNRKTMGDMYLAAVFLAYGLTLEKIDRTNPRRQKFTISGDIEEIVVQKDKKVEVRDCPSLDEVESCFISEILWLPPGYPSAIRRIKAAIHSQNDGG